MKITITLQSRPQKGRLRSTTITGDYIPKEFSLEQVKRIFEAERTINELTSIKMKFIVEN